MVRVHSLFDPASSTLTYVVYDGVDAVLIDPVMDFASGKVSAHTFERILKFVKQMRLNVHYVLETHAHADHLSSARELRAAMPGTCWAMSCEISAVFANLKRFYKWPASLALKDLGVDRLLSGGEHFRAGSLPIEVIATPGHTPACVTYRIGDNLFTGDSLMSPDFGTGRCDFPGGSAGELYDSIWGKLYALPDHLRVYVGHDYRPGGRALRPHTSLGEQKRSNIYLRLETTREEYIRFREGRDKTLQEPKLIDPSLDWNLGAHQLVARG